MTTLKAQSVKRLLALALVGLPLLLAACAPEESTELETEGEVIEEPVEEPLEEPVGEPIEEPEAGEAVEGE
ncbi:MAG: hypothetical protein VKK04_15780 [Synechococcales bacterium]|nr:hypothetical protein [Synechococcales bacterium]